MLSDKKNLALVFISLICLSLLIFGYNRSSVLESEFQAYKSNSELQIEALQKSIKSETEKNTALEAERDTLRQTIETLEQTLPVIDEFERHLIEKMGFESEMEITSDLLSKPELIPYKGVLGGTMTFISADLINDKWVYARFEDGHIMGSGVFEYKVNDDQSITWQVVKTIMY